MRTQERPTYIESLTKNLSRCSNAIIFDYELHKLYIKAIYLYNRNVWANDFCSSDSQRAQQLNSAQTIFNTLFFLYTNSFYDDSAVDVIENWSWWWRTDSPRHSGKSISSLSVNIFFWESLPNTEESDKQQQKNRNPKNHEISKKNITEIVKLWSENWLAI